ncbi:MAG: hypothetical protein ACRDO8_02070, partial [Nocardioidaceae bacterium]
PRLVAADFALWNAGNAAVVAGTLVDAVRLVDVGGGLLVLALALIVGAVRGGSPRGRRQLYAFRLLVVVLLVSIPVGLLLARTAR